MTPVIYGEIDPWPTKDRMAEILRNAGLRVVVGKDSIRIEDFDDFAFLDYGGDDPREPPQIYANTDTFDQMMRECRIVSGILTAAGFRHRIEIYNEDNDSLASYVHHEWPRDSTSTTAPPAPTPDAPVNQTDRLHRVAVIGIHTHNGAALVAGMTSSAACHRCGSVESSVACVPMWDGHRYCRGCVDNVCRGLFEFAEAHDCLEEQIDLAAIAALRQPLSWWLRMTIVPVLTIAVGIVLIATGTKLAGIVVCGLGCVSSIFKGRLLWKARHVVRPDASAPLRISAHNGCIEVSRGDRQLVNAPLTGWRWWHVAGRTESLARRVPIERFVLLEAPKSVLDAQYVCGGTPEIRERWVGFLKLANVPRIRSSLW